MAANVKIAVKTMSGDIKDIEAPLDIRTEDFIRELGIALSQPLTDAEGNPIVWRLDNKDTGRMLDPQRTLGDNGVAEGHMLLLIRNTVAGFEERIVPWQ